MNRRRRRRFATLTAWSTALALLGAGAAAAHPFPSWSGTKGPYAWDARRAACGAVGSAPGVLRAHTRWRTSPANGYMRLTFVRQIRKPGGGWATVQRQRRMTKNSPLEGARGVVHWTQWFFPFADETGDTSRHIVTFEWLRDRPGRDSRALRRQRAFRPCVVA